VYYSSREKFLNVYEFAITGFLVREDVMKRLSLAFLVVLVSMLALVSASTTALAAPATKEPFSATIQPTEMTPPERWWTDEEGTMHARGMVVTALITGDIVGQLEIIVNTNMDPSGYGDEQVKGVIKVGSEEAYRMTADITFEGGVISSSNFVLNGMGSFKGIHMTGTITTPTPGQAELTGTKLTTKP
jgi:hypothetical protein